MNAVLGENAGVYEIALAAGILGLTLMGGAVASLLTYQLFTSADSLTWIGTKTDEFISWIAMFISEIWKAVTSPDLWGSIGDIAAGILVIALIVGAIFLLSKVEKEVWEGLGTGVVYIIGGVLAVALVILILSGLSSIDWSSSGSSSCTDTYYRLGTGWCLDNK